MVQGGACARVGSSGDGARASQTASASASATASGGGARGRGRGRGHGHGRGRGPGRARGPGPGPGPGGRGCGTGSGAACGSGSGSSCQPCIKQHPTNSLSVRIPPAPRARAREITDRRDGERERCRELASPLASASLAAVAALSDSSSFSAILSCASLTLRAMSSSWRALASVTLGGLTIVFLDRFTLPPPTRAPHGTTRPAVSMRTHRDRPTLRTQDALEHAPAQDGAVQVERLLRRRDVDVLQEGEARHLRGVASQLHEGHRTGGREHLDQLLLARVRPDVADVDGAGNFVQPRRVLEPRRHWDRAHCARRPPDQARGAVARRW